MNIFFPLDVFSTIQSQIKKKKVLSKHESSRARPKLLTSWGQTLDGKVHFAGKGFSEQHLLQQVSEDERSQAFRFTGSFEFYKYSLPIKPMNLHFFAAQLLREAQMFATECFFTLEQSIPPLF